MERPNKNLLIINVILTLVYFSWWLNPVHIANLWLYLLLFVGEIYHIFMALSFWHTIWPRLDEAPMLHRDEGGPSSSSPFSPSVDVFITVVNEPLEIIRQTALAAKKMDYPNFKVFILNDGYVAETDTWQEIEKIASEIGVNYITRQTPGGAKAGNVNNALRQTDGQLVAIFDADMAPHPDFLQKTVSFFKDFSVGFVQTPQYYKNFQDNPVTEAAWQQQAFFFGPILEGKEKSNAVFLCGTNMVLRRTTLQEVGGLSEESIAEDFITSIFIHQRGWVSRYVPEILAEGLAPQDLLSYYKQQFRWARGSLVSLFNFRLILGKGLTWHQRIEYLSSALYYFNGLIIAIDLLVPLFFLFFGLQAVASATSSFAVFFLPFMFFTLYALRKSGKGSLSFQAIAFSYATWFLQINALESTLFQQKVKFSVTPKQAQAGNFRFLLYPHFFYIFIALVGCTVALFREGASPAVATNIAWTVFNIIMFIPFMQAAKLKSAVTPEKVPQLPVEIAGV